MPIVIAVFRKVLRKRSVWSETFERGNWETWGSGKYRENEPSLNNPQFYTHTHTQSHKKSLQQWRQWYNCLIDRTDYWICGETTWRTKFARTLLDLESKLNGGQSNIISRGRKETWLVLKVIHIQPIFQYCEVMFSNAYQFPGFLCSEILCGIVFYHP